MKTTKASKVKPPGASGGGGGGGGDAVAGINREVGQHMAQGAERGARHTSTGVGSSKEAGGGGDAL